MTDYLRDSIWQFIGAILGFVAIVVSVYLFIKQRSKKSLSYEVQTETALLTVNEEIKGKLQILYEGVSVQDVHLLVLKLVCDGNVPIASSDFEQPLSFSFGDKAQILTAEVIKVEPKTLKPKLDLERSKLILQPALLNSQDTLAIKILLTQYDGTIDPESRIMGLAEVKRISGRKGMFRQAILNFIVLSSIGFIILFILPPRLDFTWSTVLLIIVSSLIGAIATILMTKKLLK